MSIKVMLADDHVLCREGIKQLLEFDGSIEVISEVNDGEECLKQLEVVAEVSDGQECLDKIATVLPDVLLLDINMPKKNGIEVLKEIRKKKYPIKVLILTVHNEADYLLKAFDLGADGYMAKDSESSELKNAINNLLNGESYIQPKLVPLLNSKLIARDVDKARIDSLTKREKEILISIANGMSNREISSKLKISERTVKNHIFNLFKKIETNDRTQAAVFAIKNDLVKL